MKNIVAWCFILAMAWGCSGGKQPAAVVEPEPEVVADTIPVEAEDDEFEELIADQPMPVAAEELFDDFFFNFASSRRLQMQRIAFPLIEHTAVTDSMGQVVDMRADTVRASDWPMEHFFMHQDYYTLIFDSPAQMELVKDTAVSEAIVERIDLEGAQVRQFVFSRRNGQWMLREVKSQSLDENPNSSFLAFYQRFATDSVFQRESLCSEIDFTGPDPDDDFAQMEGVITPDFWDAFAPSLPAGHIYNIVYGHQDTTSTQRVFVLRGIANGDEVEMTFLREPDGWRLKRLNE